MEYCHSGTETLWYGSWNRHVCRKGKFAADHHSRSTGVNPSRKQRCCSPSCLWSQTQRETSDPDNSQNLGYWLTIRHRCICMWSWTEMLFFSFQLRANKTIQMPVISRICCYCKTHCVYPMLCSSLCIDRITGDTLTFNLIIHNNRQWPSDSEDWLVTWIPCRVRVWILLWTRIFFCNFRLIRVPHNLTGTIQMKSKHDIHPR